jgi:hypothetical protein
LKVSAAILFFLFSTVLIAGTNNIVLLLAELSAGLKTEIVSNKLKTSLNSIMEEEKSEKNEDVPDGKIIDIICDHISPVHFIEPKIQSEYIASNERISSIHNLPIFIPPPNI